MRVSSIFSMFKNGETTLLSAYYLDLRGRFRENLKNALDIQKI